MNIEAMAREAGIASFRGLMTSEQCDGIEIDDFYKFAAIVRAEALREAAGICEAGVDTPHPTVEGHIMRNFGRSPGLAAAILAAIDQPKA